VALESSQPRRWLIALASIAATLRNAAGQEPIVVGSQEKSVRIVRTATAPVIDGALDEPAWSSAARVDDFHQIQRTEYAPASEPTVVYLMYDADALYIGARPPSTVPIPTVVCSQKIRCWGARR
jgi:hypothetical protein